MEEAGARKEGGEKRGERERMGRREEEEERALPKETIHTQHRSSHMLEELTPVTRVLICGVEPAER